MLLTFSFFLQYGFPLEFELSLFLVLKIKIIFLKNFKQNFFVKNESSKGKNDKRGR